MSPEKKTPPKIKKTVRFAIKYDEKAGAACNIYQIAKHFSAVRKAIQKERKRICDLLPKTEPRKITHGGQNKVFDKFMEEFVLRYIKDQVI